MPFRILTYGDPYRLNQTEFWDDIRKAPHLCSSQVMVNSFRNMFEDSFDSLLCPIDNVLSFVYNGWFDNVERRIAQYMAISAQLEYWHQHDKNDREELYASLAHNQGSLLDALRLFVELGIDVQSLHISQANLEQKIFLALMNETLNSYSPLYEPFNFKTDFSISELVESFKQTINNEIIQEKNQLLEDESHNELRAIRIEKLHSLLSNFKSSSLERVVIHGLHQFSPLQLRFIMLLDQLGKEVVFLFNYQYKYKEIYSTWENVYQLFGVPIEHDTLLGPYTGIANSPSHNLAIAFGQIMESTPNNLTNERHHWYQTSQDIQMLVFENITEYAGFVSNYFDQALRKSPNNPISVMNEQIYSAGREIHDLLRVYYPEQSGDRHFLCYPIGQFFSGLYYMWNPTIGQLKLDWSLLKECFTAGILKVSQPEKLNATLELTSIYFEDIVTYSDFVGRVTHLKQHYNDIQKMQNEIGKQLRLIAFYNQSMVTMNDILDLEQAVGQLNQIAIDLFNTDEQGLVPFGLHFKRLEEFIRNQLSSLVEVEEKKLIASLLERFEKVNQSITMSGTMEDLKSGLYYYLRQKDREKPDWIVRNFVQIEGDILHSRKQHRQSVQLGKEEPVYHFACLSDHAMNKSTDDLLPWPLTDNFIRKAYSPVDLIFQVYYSALGDYARFLRYAFFYGLYYNECQVRLSYVANVGNEEELPFYPLRLLGINPQPSDDINEPLKTIPVSHQESISNTSIVADQFSIMDFFLCPYKYYLDFICRGEMVIDNNFMLKNYYENMLIDSVWQQIKGTPFIKSIEEQIRIKLKVAQDRYRPYFPFWRDTNDLFDIQRKAENYILHQLFNGRTCKNYDPTHMKVRLFFRKAIFETEMDINHPYKAFEVKTKVEDDHKQYSLNTIRWAERKALIEAMQNYMQTDLDNYAMVGEWCHSCAHKNLCLKPYQTELNVLEIEE